ncbi:MAG: hypothetical protein SGILL_001308 [Bacillariaceae sp.]
MSMPFLKPVNRKQIPKYYEIISHPMDLATIRDKIQKYDCYRTGDAMLKDFELMKNNAIKFNGSGTQIAAAAEGVYDFAKQKLEQNRAELTHLEEAVADQLTQPKKRRKTTKKKTTKKGASTPQSTGGASSGFDESFLDSMAGEIDLDLDFSSDSD